jgi:hypothetical protein
MTDNIQSMKVYVSDIVGKAMTGTFDTMFGREITTTGAGEGLGSAGNDDISSHVSLTQGAALNVDFSFHFDQKLLTAIAEETYPDQARNIPMKMICEDMACAIANVVGSRVKAFLNGRGYDLSMDIPAIGAVNDSVAAEGGQLSHLSFQYSPAGKDAAITVNIHLQEKRA